MSTTTAHATPQAAPTTLEEVRGSLTIPVFSETKPSYAGLLGLSQYTAYAHARNGAVPTMKVGKRYFVKVAVLLQMLGVEAA